MEFTSDQRLDDGVLERDFTLGEIPGVLWTPESAPAPLILIGHTGGLHKRLPRLVARARHYAAQYGFAAAAIDAPGCGDRPRSAVDEQARADLRVEQYENNPIEADHSQLKRRLRPMRGLQTDQTAQVVIAGHAFMQNLRRGHYELGLDVPPSTRLAAVFTELARAV